MSLLLVPLGLTAHAADEDSKSDVPLRQVVLFNSGVGYFEHAGQVEGTESIEFKFNVEDVNDLLKSMVLQDLGGGQISTVTYDSRDPIDKTLKTFSIDLTTNPSMADLLRQIRGEQVEIEAPNKIQGTILGVETRQQKVNRDEVMQVEMLNLLTSEGLRSVPLNSVIRIQLLNEKLDSELRQALNILATGHATDKKTVSLNFRGEGQRQVRVGYVQEMPVWKTSYRLVLKDDAPPYLQGWAIVENTTETDWRDVKLSLVSGRPISFQMDLYQPLYVRRPTVVPELYASLAPQKYDQNLSEEREQMAAGKSGSLLAGSLGGRAPARESLGRSNAPSPADYAMRYSTMEMDIAASVPSAANASDVGELFQYEIETPVTLNRRQSAMLPIVNSDVEGEKLSIYDESVHVKHPLNGVNLKNTTSLHLMQGPVTVFDDGSYAGDAQLSDLPPGSERLLSYAMDLDVEVAPETTSSPQHLVSAKIQKGVMTSILKYRRTKTYTIKNSADKPKTILVEHPADPNWKLVSPDSSNEKTRDKYRFRVKVGAGETAKLQVVEENTTHQSVNLTNVDDSWIGLFLSSDTISAEVKSALQKIVRMKQSLSELSAKIVRLERQIGEIGVEQGRIRQNMQAIDRNTDLYNRYVRKLADQESEIEKLRSDVETLKDMQSKKSKELDEFLLGLNLL